ncbi:GntR family transcriptional regulator [Pseudonocardia sp. Cha107L01]|uniref:GntR family transcriptional regulator n=1 Tax=Pseudonocardia sp. Cha107L01 TaxID=3457576 RepID=UPI00403ED1CE
MSDDVGEEQAEERPAGDVEVRGSAMWIYRQVRADILNGRLEPGAKVSQVQLAASLGVGRPTLREALRMLQNEGLVQAEHNRQMRVAPLELDDFEQLCALRLAVEPMAVQLSVPYLTDTDLAEIANAEAATARLQDIPDFEAARTAHLQFHSLLLSRAGDRVRRLAEELWQSGERYRQLMIGSSANLQAVAQLAAIEHHAILRAALDRDGAKCAELVATHITKNCLIMTSIVDGSHYPWVLHAAADRAWRTPARGDAPPNKPRGQAL